MGVCPAPGQSPGESSRQGERPLPPKVFFLQLGIFSTNLGQILALARSLRADGWDARIICRAACPLAKDAAASAVPVHLLPEGPNQGFFAAWRLLRLLHKQGLKKRVTGLVHACDPDASTLLSRTWQLDKNLRVLHTRHMPVMETAPRAVRCYQTPPAKIITDSLAGKIALRLSGLETHLLHTIPCGFDPARQPPRHERRDGRVVFAMTGPLIPDSGHSLLFQAMALLEKKKDLPPWEVRIFGEGPAFFPLLEEAQTKNVEGRLSFLGGEDIPNRLCDCDILVLPASEGATHMPLILQGWAAEIPLIAANRLDHAEFLQEGENCLFTQPGDAASLAEQMARLAKDPSLASRLAAGGLSSLAAFPLAAMILEHKRLYSQIMA